MEDGVYNTELPGVVSHIRGEPDMDPETIPVPSEENATELISWAWPPRTAVQVPDATSHIRTVLSLEPDTTRIPFDENATELTQLVWP